MRGLIVRCLIVGSHVAYVYLAGAAPYFVLRAIFPLS